MNAFLLDGRAIDWVLALVVLESLALVGWRVVTGRGPAPAALIFNLLAGAFLLLALRGALAGASPGAIASALTAALAAHIADLAGRWNAQPAAAAQPATRMRATIAFKVPKPRKVARPRPRKSESAHV